MIPLKVDPVGRDKKAVGWPDGWDRSFAPVNIDFFLDVAL